jgi:metal-responsive CopG/Arc/MetJ family transcriptional regulator
MTKQSTSITRTAISVRLPERLLVALDIFVKKNSPAIKGRTHAIEVALDKLLKEK